MKVGNIIGGLEVTDVKRVNKLNLIQFLKEVDSYLQQGYKLDAQSGRQVGLVLQCDMFKTEEASGVNKDVEVKDTVGESEPIKQEDTNTIKPVDSKAETPVVKKTGTVARATKKVL